MMLLLPLLLGMRAAGDAADVEAYTAVTALLSLRLLSIKWCR